MALTHNNVTIDFFDDFEEMPTQILISISGGLDSASLAYLICTHYPDIELIPYCCKVVDQPFDALCAIDIVQWLIERFPDNNINELDVYDVDDLDPQGLIDCAAILKENADNGTPMGYRSPRGLLKTVLIDKVTIALTNKYPGVLRCSGMTANPPIDEMKRLGFYEIAERRRDRGEGIDDIDTLSFCKMYQPFLNVDKKFIADIYKTHGLLESLVPLTSSCVGVREETDYFTKPCETCFWCNEKLWAFGHL